MKRKVHAKSGDVKVAKDINILGDRMDFRIVAVFCLYADVLKGLHHAVWEPITASFWVIPTLPVLATWVKLMDYKFECSIITISLVVYKTMFILLLY